MRILLLTIFTFSCILIQACKKVEESQPATTATISQAPEDELIIYKKSKDLDSTKMGIKDTVVSWMSLIYGINIVEKTALTDDMEDGNDAVEEKIENRYDLSVSKMENKLGQLAKNADIVCQVSTEGITYYQTPGRMDIDVSLVKDLRGSVSKTFKLPVEMKSSKEKTAYKIREGDDLVLFFEAVDKVEGNNFIPGTNYKLISIEMVH